MASDSFPDTVAARAMFDVDGNPITYRVGAPPEQDLMALTPEHKAAYLAFKAAANTLKTAEQQYKAAQVAYADAVAKLSEAVTKDPLSSSGDPTPG